MASEQVHRAEVFSETFVEIGEIQIQEQRNEGEGGTNQKQQDIRELHADRGGSQDKGVERKRREEAAKGLRDREEKETREKMKEEHARTMEHTRQAHAKQRVKEENFKHRTQNAIANTQERAKQEASVQTSRDDTTAARNKDVESKAIRVTHNKETKERPSEKSTTKGFEEGKKKPVVVCETVVKVIPQKDNESNTVGSSERVQERDIAKKQGMLRETKTQHAEKINKNRESHVLATYAEVVKGDDSASRRLQEQKLNETLVEKGFEGEKEESQVCIMQNLPMVNEPLDNKANEGGSTVLGAVGETVKEIGENILKPAKKVIEKSEEGKEGGGVLSAIGETVAEIAETTKVIAVGDGESKSKVSTESETKVSFVC
ncbi:seed biotin-containing protein SBP65-like [Vicia villosa]|uniref:seed biotin-containing protein SBP65-like n=1 Tax=Vicia villosa TaxID=3911 RepID=UPI00273A8BD0|nr:seed biotin-containing protein SBP65-like [Vicia villosa]